LRLCGFCTKIKGREVDNREWVKVHLMCGVRTKIVTSVEVSGWTAHDTNYFLPLLEATAEHFQIRDVAADKAYLSRRNLSAVEAVGAMPFVPFKSNTLEPTGAGKWAKMHHLFMYPREAFMEHYHKRSNIESAYSMSKGKFGSALRSKSDAGQINEVLCKVLCHNICRSPIAQGVFEDLVRREGLEEAVFVDSAGTGRWHVGSPPDERAQRSARVRGLDLSAQRARQVRPDDCERFDYVLTMDEENYRAVAALCRGGSVVVRPFLYYAPDRLETEVPDPYYGGPEDFEHVLDLVEAASEGLLEEIKKKHLPGRV
jgi:protein-tyrosine phosphatase